MKTDSIILEEENGEVVYLVHCWDWKVEWCMLKDLNLSEGGLYKLDVSVLTADGYSQKLDEPIVLLNIGMYVGIPAFGILKIYQFRRN